MPKPLGHKKASCKWTQPVQPFIERRLRAGERFKAHRPDDIGRFQAIMKPFDGLDSIRQYELCAIDERQPFLGAQADR